MKLTPLNNNPSFGIITTRAIHAIRQQAEGFTPYYSINSTDGYRDFEYEELSESQLKKIEALATRAARLDRVIIDCQTQANKYDDGTSRNDSSRFKEKYDGLCIMGMLKNGKFETADSVKFKKTQKGDADTTIRTFEEVVRQAEKLNPKKKFFIFNIDKNSPQNCRVIKPENMTYTDSYEDENKNSILKRIYKKITKNIILIRRDAPKG